MNYYNSSLKRILSKDMRIGINTDTSVKIILLKYEIINTNTSDDKDFLMEISYIVNTCGIRFA
jgi:hypothetical protein